MSTAPLPVSRRAALRLGSGLGLSLLAGSPARAQIVVEGYTYPPQVSLGGSTLVLNGVGLRAVAWFKGYAAGLYLTHKATTTEGVLATPGPKRIQMRMFVDVPTVEFVKAFYKGIQRNTPAHQQPALAERMQRFDALVASLGEVRIKDIVDLDYLPGQGLVLRHNARPVGDAMAGDDFYAAILRIFIGGRPVDKEMKIGLLGGPVG